MSYNRKNGEQYEISTMVVRINPDTIMLQARGFVIERDSLCCALLLVWGT